MASINSDPDRGATLQDPTEDFKKPDHFPLARAVRLVPMVKDVKGVKDSARDADSFENSADPSVGDGGEGGGEVEHDHDREQGQNMWESCSEVTIKGEAVVALKVYRHAAGKEV